MKESKEHILPQEPEELMIGIPETDQRDPREGIVAVPSEGRRYFRVRFPPEVSGKALTFKHVRQEPNPNRPGELRRVEGGDELMLGNGVYVEVDRKGNIVNKLVHEMVRRGYLVVEGDELHLPASAHESRQE